MKKDAQPAAELVAQSATGHAGKDSSIEEKKATVTSAWNLPRFNYPQATMGGNQ